MSVAGPAATRFRLENQQRLQSNVLMAFYPSDYTSEAANNFFHSFELFD